MSCSILVDDLTNRDSDVISSSSALLLTGRASPFRSRNFQPNGLSRIFAFLNRTISRRLRLLKVYMAAAVILLLLFLIFKPSATTKQPHRNQALSEALTPNEPDAFKPGNIFVHSDSKSSEAIVVRKNDHGSDTTQDLNSSANKITDKQISLHEPPAKYTQNPTPIASTNHYAIKNFTYTLSSIDFSQMRNINMMQVRIKEATKHSWDNYRRYAWGFDMLKPRSREPDHWFDLGLTIVDAADTLIMMGLTSEANLAVDWMENELRFNSTNENSNCFEMTIRVLAGLLSAQHLTGSSKLKQQAIEFGDILLHCYDSDSGIIPYSDIDLSTRRAHPPLWNPSSSLSEITSLQIEFRYLTQISGDPKYEQTTFRTSMHIHNITQGRSQKLLPMYVNPASGQLEDSIITLGARSDSYYEYLLKQYLQTGIKWLETDYLDTMDEVSERLLRHTGGAENYTYVAEMQVFRTLNETLEVKYYNKMDHLVCFLPGTLTLGYYHFSPLASEYRLKYNLETPYEKLNSRYDTHLDMAKTIARTCYNMYHRMGTGLSPEIANFIHSATDDPIMQNQPELQVQSGAAHNILRPEYVESLFYLFHVTGLPIYRAQAEEIFEAFQKYSRIPSGYSAISDVRIKPTTSTNIDEALHKYAPDRMESFWLSETLKYLYLIFCDDEHIVGTILNNYVFNTEAHLFPIV